VFLVVLLVLGFAAVNTGNNALMALLGLALGSYVVSGTWSRQVLARVEVRATVSGEVFAGRPAVVELEIANRSRIFPAYGLVVRDSSGRALVCEPLLAAKTTHRHSVEVAFPDRGWTPIGPWQLEVVLPLGFFLKAKEVLRNRSILVYPRLLRATRAQAVRGGGRQSSDVFDNRGREGEVVQLREYRDGDDRRQLHWKQTARQQRPIVVDRQQRSERPVYLVVDPRIDDPDNRQLRDRFEHMISDVATGVVRRLERGESVGLVVGPTVVPPARSSARAGRLLRPLAEVQPLAADGPPPASCRSEPVVRYRVEATG
jgi:uncharacterized protein (DUF58 family)